MTTSLSAASVSPAKSTGIADASTPSGLTSDEARHRREKFGANAMPDTSARPLRMMLDKFWAPVPWMLEAVVVLQLVLGRTAELVRTAHVASTQQKAVLRVVRNLAMFNGVLIVLLVAYAYVIGLTVAEIVPLVLTAILASIPVALPATFTLASALGGRALARLNVLPTRLSAVDEAASMDVLCADKTGTLT